MVNPKAVPQICPEEFFSSNPDIIVIGGGPSGLIASGFAAREGLNVILLERNNTVGRKLAITGKGRCNITNLCPMEEFIENFPTNPSFLYSCLNKFSPENVLDFFKNIGIKLKVERGKRVFPESDRADDIVKALFNFAISSGVKIISGHRVKEIKYNQDNFIVNIFRGKTFKTKNIILATGGVSYPVTGSTGDGHTMAKILGHSIIELQPGLIPLETIEEWPSYCKGLSLKNVEVTLLGNEKKIDKQFGEMLFTHFGISGPIILTMSSKTVPLIAGGKKVKIIIDLKPSLSEEILDQRILRDFQENSRKQIKNSLNDLLPKSLIPVILELWKIDKEKAVHQVTKTERLSLVKLLKGLILNIKGPRPISEAIITRGGISVKEINSKTMESRIIPGLYFAGEIIDIDGYTGGFNLQACFSTGYVAGTSAAERCIKLLERGKKA